MANIKIIGALIIVLAMDLFLFYGQTATASIADADASYNGNTFLQDNQTWVDSFGNNHVVNPDSMSLPEQNQITAGDESISYTDGISVTNSWIKTTGQYFVRITGGPVNYIKFLGLPQEFSFGFGALWYGLTIFLVVAFILGRE